MAPRHVIRQADVSETMQQHARSNRQPMTPEEALLWQHLHRNSLHGLHFRRQQVIGGYVVDFYCHEAALVVEVDGEIHLQQQEYDRERDRILAAKGFTVLRLRNADVHTDLPGTLKRIAEYCDRAVRSERR